MSGDLPPADTAFRVADRLRNVPGPWDVFAERIRSFEVHLNGSAIELTRGPISVEGYGIRLLRERDGKTALGFQASTDASDAGISAAVSDAETVSRYSEFPAKGVELPSTAPTTSGSLSLVDSALWKDAPGALASYTESLIAAFEGRKDVGISFGSIKGQLVDVTIANSAGLSAGYSHTSVAFEVAVKASGGPEGGPPGEYWVVDSNRRLEPERLPGQAEEWSRFARDARRAKAPPAGDLAVVLPASVLEGILPYAIGFKLSGAGELRKLAMAPGTAAAAEGVELFDDGTVAWGGGSSPFDDEGTPQRRRTLISDGKVSELIYDSMYGNALGHPSTGNGVRGSRFSISGARRFSNSPEPHMTTLTLRPGTGGTDAELVEQAGEGIWVQQLGWASPDSVTTAFGGEIRIGYRIRNGKIAEPVRGGTLGGLTLAAPGAPSLLAHIGAIGSHPDLTGRVYMPSVLVRGLTVASDERSAAASAA